MAKKLTLEQAKIDIRILFSQIDWLAEVAGIELEEEDAAMYAQIKADWLTPTPPVGGS